MYNNFMHLKPSPCRDSTSENCEPVWSRSVHTHLNGRPIKKALRTVTRCLKPTLALSGMPPAELRRKAAAFKPVPQSLEPTHALYYYITKPMTKRRLNSRKLFDNKAQTLLAYNINASTWILDRGKENWSKNISRVILNFKVRSPDRLKQFFIIELISKVSTLTVEQFNHVTKARVPQNLSSYFNYTVKKDCCDFFEHCSRRF